MKTAFSFLLLLMIAANVTAELPQWETLVDRARWAANAHNVQSWKLEPVPGRPDQKRLVLDANRLLPQTDPPSRQLTISLGAFLAVLEDEAADRGAQITWTPLADRPGALVTLGPGPTTTRPTTLVDALTAPTVKYRTTALSLPTEVRTAQEAQSNATVKIRWEVDASAVSGVRQWAEAAFDLEMSVPSTRDESIRYTRYGETARRATPWGITLVPNFPPNELFWVETFANLFPQSPEEYAKSARQMFAKALVPVEQVLVITSKGNDIRAQLETGRVLERLWLEVRASGGELLPLSQGLQEYPEMASLYAEAHRRWAEPGETVQLVLALFRPAPGLFLPSPRLAAPAILAD